MEVNIQQTAFNCTLEDAGLQVGLKKFRENGKNVKTHMMILALSGETCKSSVGEKMIAVCDYPGIPVQ